MITRPKTSRYETQEENHRSPEYGPVYTVTVPGLGRIINLADPEKLDHVLRVHFWAYEKGSHLRNTLAPMVGQGSLLAVSPRAFIDRFVYILYFSYLVDVPYKQKE